ncbi:MAG: aspartate carbamoyltransferase catalytic subunit, partial [Hyphomicrobiaceae bacterium]|nr:aspartate carbamoyltransferase catalytic subunit [Hyphomicrobiaceae bacterium]
MTVSGKMTRRFPHRHLLSCERLTAPEITFLLDIADDLAEANRARQAKREILSGRSLINLFFEASTRTQASFEMAAKRLGADVLNMNVA